MIMVADVGSGVSVPAPPRRAIFNLKIKFKFAAAGAVCQ